MNDGLQHEVHDLALDPAKPGYITAWVDLLYQLYRIFQLLIKYLQVGCLQGEFPPPRRKVVILVVLVRVVVVAVVVVGWFVCLLFKIRVREKILSQKSPTSSLHCSTSRIVLMPPSSNILPHYRFCLGVSEMNVA